jgi:hypothetical protein
MTILPHALLACAAIRNLRRKTPLPARLFAPRYAVCGLSVLAPAIRITTESKAVKARVNSIQPKSNTPAL